MIQARATPGDLADRLREALLRGLRRATLHLWTQLQHTLNVPNTGVRVRLKSGRRVTRYPDPSKPGEPPRKRTGWLQRNVVYRIDEKNLTSLVGINENAPYGLYLELGTTRMEARPWLFSTAQKCLPRMRDIITQELADA